MAVHDVSVEEFLDIDDVFSAEVIRVTRPDQLPSALAQKNKPVVIENNEMALAVSEIAALARGAEVDL